MTSCRSPRAAKDGVSPALVSTEGTIHIEDLHRQNAAKSPAHRTCRPQDVAEAIAYLAAPGASHVHGAILRMDGGLLASA
jgi:NAD(P)-dependent dehydrogenase (short-subunit alcohol dehydrogenase family)